MEKKITILQAFEMMKDFLAKYYERTNSDDVGSLLGDIEFADDLQTMDPAAWNDWLESVDKVLNETQH